MFCKKTVFKKFAKFTGKHLCSGLFFNTASDLSLKFCSKRDSATAAFLWILRNLQEHPFYRTCPGDRFSRSRNLKFLRKVVVFSVQNSFGNSDVKHIKFRESFSSYNESNDSSLQWLGLQNLQKKWGSETAIKCVL